MTGTVKISLGGTSMVEKSFLLASALLFGGLLSVAQAQPKRTVSVLINVLDQNGSTVPDLRKENFQVKLNGHVVALVDASYSLGPRRIVVLLDMRSSMKGQSINNAWPIAREALEDVLTEAPTGAQIALLTLPSQVDKIADFSQGRPAIEDWLKHGPSQRSDIKACENAYRKECTGLLDAVSEASKLLQPSQPGDVIYLITRGGDGISDVSKTDLTKQLLRNGIRLFAVLFVKDVRFEGEPPIPTSPIREVTRETGGAVFSIPGREGLRSWVVEFYEDDKTREGIMIHTREFVAKVSGFYTLELESHVRPGKLSSVSANIAEKNGSVRKNVTLTYQRVLLTPDD
jgi:hypothetical protein